MRKSVFQFSDPCLREIHFTVNEEYTALDEKNVEVGIKIGVNVKKIDGKNEATVELSIEVGDIETAPFHICVTEGAKCTSASVGIYQTCYCKSDSIFQI